MVIRCKDICYLTHQSTLSFSSHDLEPSLWLEKMGKRKSKKAIDI